ncbi:hypothetical protein [Pantoea sp.]|uniref:hypothetical protein n=1 Tax=Pantoea sp. TaxID=69393 RepID=UPI0028AB01E6|nr:hypothetical protein [Pantoea sp.]
MSKSTTLEQLQARWHEQKLAKHKRAYSAAGRPGKSRWSEIFEAHKRRVLRRNGVRNRAANVAGTLSDYQAWAEMVRANRKHFGLPPQVHRFGNSGKEKMQ